MLIKGRQAFLDSDKAQLLRDELEEMVKNPDYNTHLVYTLVRSEGNQFVEKHMKYMGDHLAMNHSQYVSNLKLMTKVRK